MPEGFPESHEWDGLDEDEPDNLDSGEPDDED
jgi:hypothetical protein